MKACVLGAGAWGAALALVLTDTGHDVVLWDRDAKVIDSVNVRHRALKLQDLELPQTIKASLSVGQALTGASVVVSAIPSTALADVTRSFGPFIPEDALLVSATKGLDADTLARPTEAWIQRNPSLDSRIVAVSGPNFAIEIARKLPAATVVASRSSEASRRAQSAFMTSYLRA